MLIANAEPYGAAPARIRHQLPAANAGAVATKVGDGRGLADIRIAGARIAAIGELTRRPGEQVIDQRGAAVLPGLNDHHIHLMAYAAALESVACGPPRVHTEAELMEALAHASPAAHGWVRGIGYHESVAGDIDCQWLDRVRPEVPVRVQHRTGRLWIVNSAGLDRLAQVNISHQHPAADADSLATKIDDKCGLACGNRLPLRGRRGRFFDQDDVLRGMWGMRGAGNPPLAAASRRLASYGVTGLTDLTPDNDTAAAAAFEGYRSSGALLQQIRVGGKLGMHHSLVGPTKVHLHDSSLPDFMDLVRLIEGSHDRGREVATHCVTESELVFALSAFQEAGARPGDRVEHASVTPPALLQQIRELGLLVVTQPHFIAERGDAYLRDLPAEEHPWLYRCRGFLDAGIPLAAGSDAPFGHADPWRAMRAAVHRQSASGRSLGPDEALSAEQALSLYLGSLDAPEKVRRMEVGARADLCLLDRPWGQARTRLQSDCVRATLQAGQCVFRRDRQPENTQSTGTAMHGTT